MELLRIQNWTFLQLQISNVFIEFVPDGDSS